ncbi:MAG: hypothetical protein WCB11_12345 [Terriglobales bacterium]|jgi:hypothetical protein
MLKRHEVEILLKAGHGHRRPRHWYEDVDRLHAILQSHGPEVLRRAMEAGLQQQVFGALYVERCLQPGLNFPEAVQ